MDAQDWADLATVFRAGADRSRGETGHVHVHARGPARSLWGEI